MNGARQLRLRNALLFRRHHKHGHHRQHSAIHGHGHGYAIQRDVVEEDLHILDGIDGDAGFPHVALHAGMIRVVTAMGREVESHRQAALSGFEIVAEKGIGFFGGGETRILTQRPRPARVHGGARPAHEGRESRQLVAVFDVLEILGRVERLYVDTFRCRQHELIDVPSLQLLDCARRPVVQRRFFELGHNRLPPESTDHAPRA